MNTRVCVECRLLCTWHQLRSNPINKSLCSVLMISFQCDHTLRATDQFKIHLTNHQMTVSSEIGWYLTNGWRNMKRFSHITPLSAFQLTLISSPGSPRDRPMAPRRPAALPCRVWCRVLGLTRTTFQHPSKASHRSKNRNLVFQPWEDLCHSLGKWYEHHN